MGSFQSHNRLSKFQNYYIRLEGNLSILFGLCVSSIIKGFFLFGQWRFVTHKSHVEQVWDSWGRLAMHLDVKPIEIINNNLPRLTFSMAMWESSTLTFSVDTFLMYFIQFNRITVKHQFETFECFLLHMMLKFISYLIVLICARTHTFSHYTFIRMNGDSDRPFKWENVWTWNHLCTLTRTRLIDPIADSVSLWTASEFQLWT